MANRSPMLISSILLLSGLLVLGQLPVVPLQTTPVASAFNPASVGQIRRWWNFHDLALNITVSNQWNDEIHNEPMWMMNTTKSPTNSSLGVRFNAAQQLTNNDLTFAGCSDQTVFMVFTFENPATFPAINNGQVSSSGLNIDTGSRLNWIATANHTESSALLSSTLLDVGIVLSNATATYFYTNGVLSKIDSAEVNWPNQNSLGNDQNAEALKGYVRHYIVWSNVLSSATISNLHYWRTNTEGGTP